MSKNKTIVSILMLGALVVFSGCTSEEKKELIEKKENFSIVNTYEYDTTEGAILDKQTPKELASAILKENVGIDDGKKGYAPVGTSDKNGIFINSGISEGDGIPEYPSLTKDEISSENKDELEDYFEKRKKDDYNSLLENRQKALRENNANLTDEQKLENQLTERIEKQQQDIAEGKVKNKSKNDTK